MSRKIRAAIPVYIIGGSFVRFLEKKNLDVFLDLLRKQSAKEYLDEIVKEFVENLLRNFWRDSWRSS